MRYLCLDTSNGASMSVVDRTENTFTTIVKKEMSDSQMHGEKLAVMLEEILKALGVQNILEAKIDKVVCSIGPAPFTGLRAGLVTSRIIAKIANVPIVGICALDVLALQGFEQFSDVNEIFVATDAKRKEIYYCIYTKNGMNDVLPVFDVKVNKPEEALLDVKNAFSEKSCLNSPIVNVGQGCMKYNDLFPVEKDAPMFVDSSYMAKIAYYREKNGVNIDKIDPMYLRRPDVCMPKAVK